MRLRAVGALVSVLLLLAGCFPERPSVLVILLDDARPDELPGLSEDSLTFTNAFVTSPSCGPSRANFLSGRFRASRVNGYPNDFDQSDTIATRLSEAGYRTGFFGKYVNSADRVGLPTPAPGWDRWQQYVDPSISYGFTTRSSDGIEWQPPGHADEWMLGELIDWIARTPGPLFALWATHGPHVEDRFGAVVPPVEYRGLLGDPAIRGGEIRAREFGLFFADAVDEIRERFPDLVVVLTSDNGLSRGSHGVYGKACPWNDCVSVPLRVYGSLLHPTHFESPVVLVDLTQTILAVARAQADGLDGCDLRLRRGSHCRRVIPFSDGGAVWPFRSDRWDAWLSRSGMRIEWDPRDNDRGVELFSAREWLGEDEHSPTSDRHRRPECRQAASGKRHPDSEPESHRTESRCRRPRRRN